VRVGLFNTGGVVGTARLSSARESVEDGDEVGCRGGVGRDGSRAMVGLAVVDSDVERIGRCVRAGDEFEMKGSWIRAGAALLANVWRICGGGEE
jgi:hypothetical protein